jgi:hypothetical protein
MLTAAIALSISSQGNAAAFYIGEVEGQFDSSLSVGASWAIRGADPSNIGAFYGGEASSNTNDDGRLNFKKGETFSKIFKGLHDLELRYADSGLFLRGKYWYDFELKDEARQLYDISDDRRKAAAQSSGVQLLDAFVYHNYMVGGQPGSVRLGKQVVSWGESTFIGNSINSISPVDVAAFRRPGAELKEGLIPVNLFYLSQGLSNTLAAEFFYQLEWDQTVVDNCGTFFSGDTIADGCADRMEATLPGALGVQNTYLTRGGDRDARDSGQFKNTNQVKRRQMRSGHDVAAQLYKGMSVRSNKDAARVSQCCIAFHRLRSCAVSYRLASSAARTLLATRPSCAFGIAPPLSVSLAKATHEND